jgi:uncharacterized protein (DUF1778 family)
MELDRANEHASAVIAKEKEMGRLEQDVSRYMGLLDGVQKHIKTLLKHLHGQV